MPVTLKAANVKYKSAITGEYVGVNSVSDNTTAEQIASIETAGQQQINAVVAQGQATIASIPVDYTNLSNEVTDLKSAFDSNRTGTIEFNPFGCYRYASDGLSTIDIATMPLNTYAYVQYSVVKTSLETANIPFSWSNANYIVIFKRAGHRNSSGTSVIELFNSSTKQHASMIYIPSSSDDKYRWILPSASLTEQYVPADAKAVGDALDTLIYGGRTKSTLTSLPFCWLNTGSMQTLDFRDMPMNTFAWVEYSKIKTGLSDTNMPENDWSDSDSVAVYKMDTRKGALSPNSVVTFYNFTKTRKIEMLYYAGSSGNKYRWILTDITNNNTINYTYNQYANEYNISASPEITTDTNNYLQPSGDSTDMASAIETMLTQTGVCNLAPGDFYVSGIDMSDSSMIRGSGTKTRIILLNSVSDGYAIKMGTRCIVEDCRILGSTSSYTPTSTIGTRNGIIWQGTATLSSTTSSKPARGTISNCYIQNFSGGGIYCQGTGTGISNCLNVANVFIADCTVGIYIPLLSEFNRFTNVDCRGCYYGSINNGGNNVFANCGFSKNIIGVMIDNEYDQSTNSAHGTYTGCVFNHSGANNDGIAIKLLGITAGEIFTGCQVFFGSIEINDSKGIVFDGCNLGTSIPISIEDGKTVLFTNCMFANVPTVTKTNNTDTHFANCYTREGDAVSA